METSGKRLLRWMHSQGLTQQAVAAKMGVTHTAVNKWLNGKNDISSDALKRLNQEFGLSPTYLLLGLGGAYHTEKTIDVQAGDVSIVPILSQRVGAGAQELLDASSIERRIPVPSAWNLDKKLIGLEVRGDSMTKIGLFDGDVVFFEPHLLRGDGIYVIKIHDELMVKRIEFDALNRTIAIISENDRYKPRVESADSQAIQIMGKVRGWFHKHPY